MTATEKLAQEAEAYKGNKGLLTPIYQHLLGIMDEELSALVLRDDYTLGEMVHFVTEKARKELDGVSGALADDVVYGFATDYYHSSREEINKLLCPAITKTTSVVKPEAKPEAKPKPVKPKEAKAEQQITLFDLLEG